MLRSLIAVIAATLAGLFVAKFVEGAVLTAIGSAGTATATPHQLILMSSWFAGAITATMFALLFGRRWAPLGWLGAATVGFSAFIVLIGGAFSWWVWPGAALSVGAGGWLPVKLMRVVSQLPQGSRKGGLFE